MKIGACPTTAMGARSSTKRISELLQKASHMGDRQLIGGHCPLGLPSAHMCPVPIKHGIYLLLDSFALGGIR